MGRQRDSLVQVRRGTSGFSNQPDVCIHADGAGPQSPAAFLTPGGILLLLLVRSCPHPKCRSGRSHSCHLQGGSWLWHTTEMGQRLSVIREISASEATTDTESSLVSEQRI